MKTPIIALLSDFGLKDHYVASLKGVIASIDPQLRIMDICHEVTPQNILQGAFILREVFPLYPKGTIFICVVDPGVGSSRRAVCVRHDFGYFLGPDNGLMELAINTLHRYEAREIQCSELFRKPVSRTFHGRDIFAPVAAHLAKGFRFQTVGPVALNLKAVNLEKATIGKHVVAGEIIYIDQFGNGITNINRIMLKEKKVTAIRIKNYLVKRIQNSFSDGHSNELIAVWNSSEMLEFAAPNGSAAVKYKLIIGDKVKVAFL